MIGSIVFHRMPSVIQGSARLARATPGRADADPRAGPNWIRLADSHGQRRLRVPL